MSPIVSVVVISALFLAVGCASPVARPKFVIVIHGGAGSMRVETPEADKAATRAGLTKALTAGRDILAAGGSAVDAVEAAVRVLEDDERFNAGKGAVYNDQGKHELDAAIMDGSTLQCGAVAAVRTVKNPIALARIVMEKSGHILLGGDGAEAYADVVGVERVPNSYFDTPRRLEQLRKALEERKRQDPAAEKGHGTVGAVALDVHGNLAAATSTGGRTAKRFGRIGDTPLIGAGTYANKYVAVSCTGVGEEFMRHVAAYDVAALVQYKGWSLQRAADEQIFHKLRPDDGGLIAVSHKGEVAMPYSTSAMSRGVADSGGRFEVRITKDK